MKTSTNLFWRSRSAFHFNEDKTNHSVHIVESKGIFGHKPSLGSALHSSLLKLISLIRTHPDFLELCFSWICDSSLTLSPNNWWEGRIYNQKEKKKNPDSFAALVFLSSMMLNHKALWSPLHSSKLSGLSDLANRPNLLQPCTSQPVFSLPHLKGQTFTFSVQLQEVRLHFLPHLQHRCQQRGSKTSGWSAQALCGTEHPSLDGVCWFHGALQRADIRKVQKMLHGNTKP